MIVVMINIPYVSCISMIPGTGVKEFPFMSQKKLLPSVEIFVSEMRGVCENTEGDERWKRCRELLVELLRDPELQDHARDWPVGGFDG